MAEIEPNRDFADINYDVTTGIQDILGPKVAFHFAIRHPDITDMITGGLYETPEQATRARSKMVSTQLDIIKKMPHLSRREIASHISKWTTTPIFELGIGDQYHPANTIAPSYTHGKDDGFHKSKIKCLQDKKVLNPKNPD